MRYKMLTPDDDVVHVELKVTPKTITITPLDPREKFGFMYGCIEKLWEKGKIIKRVGKTSNDCLEDWGDGTYTLYPEKQGLPFYLEPERGDNAD